MNPVSRRALLKLGAISGLGAASHATAVAGENAAPAAPAAKEPPVKTRMFWTWDHSTEWALNRLGAQTMGASNHYGRNSDAFVEDYTQLLRWCGRRGIDAVVVWGLLRDCHGGLETAKRLCDVAAKEKVRLLCGVGLNAYGGVYYEGDSPYSLERHLQAHADLYALDAAGKKMAFHFGLFGPRVSHHACPSRRENQDFAAESLAWLFKSLPLGGVQLESGDTGVCQCKACRDRRVHPVSGFSWEDMAMVYPPAASAIRSVAPDAWIVCETYSHPQPYRGPDKAPNFGEGKPPWADAMLAKFPRGVFVQWVCDKFVKPNPAHAWTAEGRVSGAGLRHVMRSHFGTYWGRFRGELAIDWIADMFARSMAAGFDAISLFGEVSPFHTGAELNYLALADFGGRENPTADLDAFLRRVAGPLLGGADHARDYLRFARLLDDRAAIPAALRTIHARVASLPPEPARRWCWLANYLASFVHQTP